MKTLCSSNADFYLMKTDRHRASGGAQMLSHALLFVTPWALVRQGPRVMGFFWQEYWSRLPFPSPGDLSDPGVKPVSPMSSALQAVSLPLSHLGSRMSQWDLRKNGDY